MDTRQINTNVLAIIGDAFFSLYIREKLINMGINNPNILQKKSVDYVSAKAQAKIITDLIDNNILTDEEIRTFKRGRNNKNNNHPKNTDIITYKLSTGFESLIGELYLTNKNRLIEILSINEVK